MQINEPLGPALDDDSTTAFLFASSSGKLLGVTLDAGGANLPAWQGERWVLRAQFNLGVHEPVPAPIDPEPILRGVKAQGYYVWPARRLQPLGTAQ
jgi:hypothetical protein